MTMPEQRNHGLDLIKWLAIGTMVIDHLRYVSWLADLGLNDYFTLIGRWAFPLFCVAIAANMQRIIEMQRTASFKRYLWQLGGFSLLSEIPYRMCVKDAQVINIMPTLFLGVLLLWLVTTPSKYHWLWLTLLCVLLLLMSPLFMYGALGVLLPTAFYFALLATGRVRWFALMGAAVVAALSNLQYYLPPLANEAQLTIVSLGFALNAAIAVFVGDQLLKHDLKYPVLPVGAWGYWFYPTHFLVIFTLSSI